MRRFIPISIEEYIDLHVENSGDVTSEDLRYFLTDALYAYRQSVLCSCGKPIWVIGSALVGEYGCFECLTGDEVTDTSFEIEEACSREENSLGMIDEMFMEQVSDIFAKHPDDYAGELEKLGFDWVDDDTDAKEEAEEAAAVPENRVQKKLVSFLENERPFTDEFLDLYIRERKSEGFNLPLFRKYFKRANKNLKQMILQGLNRFPTNIMLLEDLSYLTYFDNLLEETINRYLKALTLSGAGEEFYSLAANFCFYTQGFDYEAVSELMERFKNDPEKILVINEIKKEFEHREVEIFDTIQ